MMGLLVVLSATGCTNKAELEQAQERAEMYKAEAEKYKAEAARLEDELSKKKPGSSAAVPPEGPGLPRSLTVRYKGLTADAWGQQLFDADPGVSAEAAFALSSIGEEGARFLLEGMKSPTFHIREQSLHCFHASVAKKWKAQVLPVLRATLEDRNWPGLGEKAAALIRDAEIVEALLDLRKLREWISLPGSKARLDQWIGELEAIKAP
jgi:hypothetical protein